MPDDLICWRKFNFILFAGVLWCRGLLTHKPSGINTSSIIITIRIVCSLVFDDLWTVCTLEEKSMLVSGKMIMNWLACVQWHYWYSITGIYGIWPCTAGDVLDHESHIHLYLGRWKRKRSPHKLGGKPTKIGASIVKLPSDISPLTRRANV